MKLDAEGYRIFTLAEFKALEDDQRDQGHVKSPNHRNRDKRKVKGNSRFYKRSFQAKAEENRKGHVSLIKHEAALQGYTCLVSTLFIKRVL